MQYDQRNNRGVDRDCEQLLLGKSPQMEKIRQKLQHYAPLSYPVLIEGETGTGKEFAARYLHQRATDRTQPFVAVNCGTLHSGLAAAELFGCTRGAFTGARQRDGLIKRAQGGILFLDEIADLPLDVQVMLLRTLESNMSRPVGSDDCHRVSFRLVCATHKPIQRLVETGHFRRDLYFRLSILRVRMPALRERPHDIGTLLDELCPFDPSNIPLSARHVLYSYDYPGNIRELRNILIDLSIQNANGGIDVEQLKALLRDKTASTVGDTSISLNRKITQYIQEVYTQQNGNIRKTARVLEVSPTTVYKYLSIMGGETPVCANLRRSVRLSSVSLENQR